MRQTAGLVELIGLTEKFTFNPKEGIDNPIMVITDDADWTPTLRLCVLKREEGESYGFHLRVERDCQGHVIRKVTSWGVAERSGLRNGDRLLEVNDCFIDNVPHPEVARKIKLSGQQLGLLVLEGDDYDQAVSRGLDLRALAMAHKGEGRKAPRLCHIIRDPNAGLGINFTPVEGEKGRFSVGLVTGGAAEKAGVCKGDRLVWMDGAIVSDLTHSALSKMVKKFGNHITILVIDSESESNYIRHKMPILPAMAIPHNLPHRARKIHLGLGSEGYGFLLRLQKTSSGRVVGHAIREVDSDSPAERAGMQEGDLLLEVNEELIVSLTHEEVVDQVRHSGQQVTLTTITPQGLEFYSRLGLSPLLFCEEDNAVEREQECSVPTSLVVERTQKEGPADIHRRRSCFLQKGPLGFAFNLSCIQHMPGTCISQVALGGSGQRAGLLEGDVLIEVNGHNVEGKDLEDVIMLVREGGNFLSLVVMDRDGYTTLKESQKAASTTEFLEVEEDENVEISAL